MFPGRPTRILAVRFEGTLSTASPRDSKVFDLGSPREEVIREVNALHALYSIVVVSTIGGSWNGRTALLSWLVDNGVLFDYVSEEVGIPVCDAFLDDASHDVSDKSLALLKGEQDAPADS